MYWSFFCWWISCVFNMILCKNWYEIEGKKVFWFIACTRNVCKWLKESIDDVTNTETNKWQYHTSLKDAFHFAYETYHGKWENMSHMYPELLTKFVRDRDIAIIVHRWSSFFLYWRIQMTGGEFSCKLNTLGQRFKPKQLMDVTPIWLYFKLKLQWMC